MTMQEEPYFTPEQWETTKMVVAVLMIVPGIFLLRAAAFFLLPRSVLRFFFMGGDKPTMPEESLKRRNRFWEDYDD